MEKENKKQKDYYKLEKKLQKPGTTLQEILQEELVVEAYRSNNVLLHNFLKLNDYIKLIEYATVLANEDDKLRGFKYPQVACDILSSEIPKVWEMMFMVIEDGHPPHILLFQLLKYFDYQPNYTLSGYVMKILNNLYFYEPAKVQQALIQSHKLSKILGFLSSRSVSQFIVKLIVVQNQSILTLFFKERRDLFGQLIVLYDKNERQQDYLSQVSYILGQIMNKLWGSKHKELGRFSQSLLQLVQIIIGKQKLSNQQSLMLIVIKHLSNYIEDAPFLIKAILSKAYKEISSNYFETMKSTHKTPVTKFGPKKLKLLQCLSSGFSSCIALVETMANVHVYFNVFLNLMVKHEWNNLVHVEVETIFREVFKSASPDLFKSMFQKGRFGEAVKDLIKKEERKQPKGYLGTFINIVSSMNQGVIKNTQFGRFLRREEPRFIDSIEQFLKPKEALYVFDLAGYSVNLKTTNPQYDQQLLLDKHKDFLDSTNLSIAARQLIKSISSTSDSKISQTLTNEIEDQNVLNSKFYEESSSPEKSTT